MAIPLDLEIEFSLGQKRLDLDFEAVSIFSYVKTKYPMRSEIWILLWESGAERRRVGAALLVVFRQAAIEGIEEHESRLQLNRRQRLMSFSAKFPAPLSLSSVPQRRSHDDKQRITRFTCISYLVWELLLKHMLKLSVLKTGSDRPVEPVRP
ncbi:LOW QUALITY PROTEIN: hypothetical protein YC2023_120733 [Brassica napus]